MKEFLENNAYFVDFFNAYFFDGEKVLEAMNCEELDSEMNDANMDLEKHVDVIRKYNDGNLAYFGQAYTDWRDGDQQKDYEKVYAFGIDFNYLLRNYKTIDTDIINNLCAVIEKRIKEQTGEGVDN